MTSRLALRPLLASLATLALAAGCTGSTGSTAAPVSTTASATARAAVQTATLAPATPATTVASGAAGQPQTIHVLEVPTDFSQVKAGSLTGCKAADCQGDTLVGHSRLIDATTHEAVGTLLVNCVLVDPAQSLYSCPANTITLTARGQIVYTETLRLVTGAAQDLWPIIGGTGEFLGVTGTVTSPADSTYQYGDFVITFTR